MNRRRPILGLALCLAATAAAADDLRGKDIFVCTAWHAVMCTTEGECSPTEAWRLDMPDFLRVDLRAGEMGTPESSDRPRFTTIQNIGRNEGRVFLSGWQAARSYTWVINEESGEGSLAIASDSAVVTLFTACAASDNLR